MFASLVLALSLSLTGQHGGHAAHAAPAKHHTTQTHHYQSTSIYGVGGYYGPYYGGYQSAPGRSYVPFNDPTSPVYFPAAESLSQFAVPFFQLP